MKNKYFFLIFIFSYSILTLISEIKYTNKIIKSNQLSGRADGYSEANSLRGSLYLKEKGLFYTSGLANIGYGNIYPDHGRGIDNNEIYTHYPPGPEYVLYFYRLFSDDIYSYRILNIFLCMTVIIFFLIQLYKILGESNKAIIPIVFLTIVPIFFNTMHGLHQTTYCFYLNILSTSFIFLFLRGKFSSKKLLISTFFISFVQGWMTFDYFFIVTLGAVPLLLLFKADKKTIYKIILVNFLGFSLAHALHFLQVIFFFGGIQEAINDFLGAAKTRSVEGSVSLSSVFYEYFNYHIRRSRYFNFKIQYLLIIHSFFFLRDYIYRKNSVKNALTSPLALSLFAFFISSLWLIVMKQHASIHTHFIPRHYYPFYLVLVLSIYVYIVNNNETRTKEIN